METVKRYINSIYVGSIVMLYDNKYGDEDQLLTSQLGADDGLSVTLHDEQKCDYVKLKYNQLVIQGNFTCRIPTQNLRFKEFFLA